MSSPQVIEKAPMSVTQVKVALERIKASEEGLELNFRALRETAAHGRGGGLRCHPQA